MSTTIRARTVSRSGRASAPGLIAQGLRDIWSRRRLTQYLVRADLTKKGADTILGNVWWVLDPLLQMGVYVIMVTIILKVTKPDYPLFVFAAILPWKWFSTAVNDAIGSVISRERIIKQVNFPKIVLPVAATVSGVINFAFGMIPLAGLLILFYPHRISPYLLLIPVIAVVQFVFSLALAIALSAFNVFYRDVGNVSRHVLRMWFYLSPALYSSEQIRSLSNGTIGKLLVLNPFTTLFEAYRAVIYDGALPPFDALAALLVVSSVLVLLATLLFKRVEPAFAKIL